MNVSVKKIKTIQYKNVGIHITRHLFNIQGVKSGQVLLNGDLLRNGQPVRPDQRGQLAPVSGKPTNPKRRKYTRDFEMIPKNPSFYLNNTRILF